jgi:hypothetical protein
LCLPVVVKMVLDMVLATMVLLDLIIDYNCV